jgi:CBS-domain-containing membrane protein
LAACLLTLRYTEHPLLLASLGGSCVILFGMPESDMAQPRSLIGGHIISSVVGLAFLHFGGSSDLYAIAAVATALVGMMATRTIHSPAGANPIVIFAEGARWSFLWSPLAIGLVFLLAAALLFGRCGRNRVSYPREWI